MPHFSVLVPAYNASSTIRETLDSIRAQTFTDWECVVVDDGSADDTAQIVAEYAEQDQRFRLIRQENRGAAGAYRTAVSGAHSDLLIICSADDLLLPAHMVTMEDLIRRNPSCGIFSSNGEYLDDDTGEREVVYVSEEWQEERSLSIEQVILQCFFSVGAVFRREVYELTGGHRPGVYVDDYDLWLRAMAKGMLHRYTPEVLSVHRVSSFQQSADVVRVWRSDIAVYEHLREENELSPGASAALEAAIAERAQRIEEYPAEMERRAVQEVMEQQAGTLRGRVERIVGPRHADRVLRVIHSVSWITRPARRFLAKPRRR